MDVGSAVPISMTNTAKTSVMQPSRTVVESVAEAGIQWGSADAQSVDLSTAEVITHHLGEFGMDNVWVLLVFVFLNPHLQHVSV